MNRKKKSIHQILWKYKQQQPLTPREETVLFNWLSASELRQQLFDELSNENYWNSEVEAFRAKDGDPAWNIIAQRLDDIEYFEVKQPAAWKPYAVAASIVAVAVATFFLFNAPKAEKPRNEGYASAIGKKDDVQPASANAQLRLGDGSLINLSSMDKKMLPLERFGIYLSAEDGFLVYRTGGSSRVERHTLITPRATQYKVSLPDGSRVWLNAGSSLSYPTKFVEGTREVELAGEAYFEVAKMPSKRFIVKAGNSSINVLGTHFNVHAYGDEGKVVTTLLEGSVLIKTATDSVKLIPGEKATVTSDNQMKVIMTDAEQSVAWKDKMFWFQEATIPEIMKEIERWYNVKVVFKGAATGKFSGILPRDLTLGQLLKVLESGTAVSFEVKNKTITVGP